MPGTACRSRAIRSVTLWAGKLPAFTGLGALHDLDLQLFGSREVFGGDAEPGRGDLLDPVVGPVAVAEAVVVRRVLAAFPGVGPGSHAVHGDGERRVRLGRQRAQRHGG